MSLLDALDLAHRIDLPLEAWWHAVLTSVDDTYNGRVVMAMAGLGSPSILVRAYFGRVEPDVAVGLTGTFDMDTNLYLASRGPVFSWPEARRDAPRHLGAARAEHLETLVAAVGLSECVCVASFDPSLVGVSVNLAPRHDSAGAIAGVVEIVAHVAAGFRLRELLMKGQGELEAVLFPDGRVAHATGSARRSEALAALRFATRALERTRLNSQQHSAEDALLAQRVLVEGRWSLVHEEESDGRRLILARVNDPVSALPLLPELPMRQQQVALLAALGHPLKQIAYELGLSVPTMSRALQAAQAGLGVRSKSALVQEVVRRMGVRCAIDRPEEPSPGGT